MKIIRDIDQGSPEWLQMRLGIPTASEFNKIITAKGDLSKSLDKLAFELAVQMLVSEAPETYKSAAMQRGNDLEPYARQAYQEHTLDVVEQVTFIDCGDYGCSPDGLVGDNGMVEIKCPSLDTHLQYLLDNKLPTAYIQQVQGQLFVAERKWCDFVSYAPEYKKPEHRLFIHRVYKDDVFCSKLKIGIELLINKRNEILAKL